MRKDKKPDTFAVINRHTDTQPDGHVDSMTDPAQRAESVKIITYNLLLTNYNLRLKTYNLQLSTNKLQLLTSQIDLSS